MPLTLYHGSKGGLQGSISLTDRNRCSCDFGRGFYMGDEIHQPQTLICGAENPVLYTMKFDLEDLKVYRFEPDENWAMFVAFNRGKLQTYRKYPFYGNFERIRRENDVIIGRIADDKIFGVLNMFFEGFVGITALVESLSALKIGNQYCALTEKAFRKIEILKTKKLTVHECELLKVRKLRQAAHAEAMAHDICKRMRREGLGFHELIEKLKEEK